MNIRNNIDHVRDCYGCGVCAASCGKKIISLSLNDDGFYEPHIVDAEKCSSCGICIDVCSYLHDEQVVGNFRPLKSWAAWSNDEEIRRKCSSGGISFELGKSLLEQGYKVVGCRYSISEQIAEHFIASTVEELIQSVGSKYIQSYTVDAFNRIKRKGQKYFVTGTPCQIDSFRRMIQKFHCEENFVLMDFFCHGVPSMHVWKAYLKMQEKKLGKITYASWRNKFEYGWHDSWLVSLDGEKTSQPINWHDSYNVLIKGKKGAMNSRLSQGDLFYKVFLGDFASGIQCEKKCKFKYDKSSADIRIGDLWGKTYADDVLGVSALIAFTTKGVQIIGRLSKVSLKEHTFPIVAEGQMKSNIHNSRLRPIVLSLLKKGTNLKNPIFNLLFIIQKIIKHLKCI